MGYTLPLYGQNSYGAVTASANSVINRLVEPVRNALTVITKMVYINQADAHTITVLRPLGSTTFAADAAAGQAAVVLTADPGNYAATWRTADNLIGSGDYVVYRAADGTYVVDTVASGSGTTPTLTTNLPTLGVLAGAPLWFYGIKTDVNPSNAQAHPKFTVVPTGSGYGVKNFPDSDSDIVASSIGVYEPLIIQSDNLISAGTLNFVSVAYTNRGGPNVSNAAGTANA